MGTIELPELPTGKEFEEYISAYFQVGGYYIERNIEEKEVLELDIIITDYNKRPPEIILLEVKSGDWGFHDLFKIRGWMDYLNISKSLFITCKDKTNSDLLREKAKNLNIYLTVITDLENTKEYLSKFIKSEISEIDISIWRYAYWIERKLIERLKHKKKSIQHKKCFKALDDYYSKVNNDIFFIENIVQRVDELYSTFMKYFHISAKTGYELQGGTFEKEYSTIPQNLFRETYHECKYTDIQISTFIEHKARLAVLKNAIDYKLYKDAGINCKVDSTLKIPCILGDEFEILLIYLLPSSFRRGLEKISTHEYFYRYPIFWQWFMWVFGGFILNDYEEEEYILLSQKTGIPVDEIPRALDSFEILFPVEGGWFINLSNSNIRVMKMFPVPFMGIGANYRRLIYTESGKYEELNLTGRHTLNDLIKWNNLTVEVLEG